MNDSKIRVAVRVRPLSEKERNDDATIVTQIINDTSLSIDGMSTNFNCDYAFGMDSTQSNVYNKMCNGIIDKLFEGYNSTIFAYGQTGSGKTHTMGSASCINKYDYGISHLTIQDIFKKKSELEKNGASVNVEVSYVEVYLEDSYDLLSGPKYGGNIRSQVELKENKNGETYLDGLKSIPVSNIEEVLLCLEDASTKRSTGSTLMNLTSSRSHAICTLSMKITKASTGDSIFNTVISKLHLVDLAGSERAKKTQATGDRLNEGININKGLSVLGRVVKALQMEQSHIPYRESKLTRILKDSLGGNSCTVMLACISPSNMNKDESISTLKFAECAGSIVNKASVNTHYDEEYTKNNEALVKEISKLKQQNMNLQQQNYALQNNSSLLSKSSSNVVKSITNNDIISGSVLLAGVIRSLLVKCLEEGADVDEDEVISIRSDISAMRTGIGSVIAVDNNEDGDKNDFMPPLFKLVEEIETLEKELSVMIDPTNNIDDDEDDNDDNCNSSLDENVNSINENICNDNVTKDTESLQKKQNELNTVS
jgi:kinesin family protein 4/21/27